MRRYSGEDGQPGGGGPAADTAAEHGQQAREYHTLLASTDAAV